MFVADQTNIYDNQKYPVSVVICI